MQTDCLIEAGAPADAHQPGAAMGPEKLPTLQVRLRFLHLQARTVERILDAAAEEFEPVGRLEVKGEELFPWDEAVDERVDLPVVELSALLGEARSHPLEVPGDRDIELVRDDAGGISGRIVRTRWPISGSVRLEAEEIDGFFRVRVCIENTSRLSGPEAPLRDAALRHALLSAHTLLAVSGGRFVSLLDVPPEASRAVGLLDNRNTWPVLVGEPGQRNMMLSSPIILYDHPQIAPESPGDLFDSTEIDEILTLRILTLTDDEKREARATDERARRILDRSETIPPEIFERLHGAVRSMGPATSVSPLASAPFWEPEARVPADLASVMIAGCEVARGSRVVLRPGPRGDSMDMFLVGKEARVEGVFETVDNETFVAVTVGDDPASDMHSWYGRYFYFRPAELEPLDAMASDR